MHCLLIAKKPCAVEKSGMDPTENNLSLNDLWWLNGKESSCKAGAMGEMNIPFYLQQIRQAINF